VRVKHFQETIVPITTLACVISSCMGVSNVSSAQTANVQRPDSEGITTLRERELLAQIHDLQERVEALEARQNGTKGPLHLGSQTPAGALSTQPPSVDPLPSSAPPANLTTPSSTQVSVTQSSLTTRYATAQAPSSADAASTSPAQWGALEPGRGFKLAKTEYGELNLSGYALVRYLNQLPASHTYTSYSGISKTSNGRSDIQLQRALIWMNGWVYHPKFNYEVLLWTVNSINQVTVAGKLGYNFHPAFNLYGGIGGLPGVRSMTGAFPYFAGTDRVMAEEFFRPGFTTGIWAVGALSKKSRYMVMLGNNLSQIGLTANKLTRSPAVAASAWWMPTSGEFGSRGGFGDYERHKTLATRFGFSYTHSPETRGNQPDPESGPDNVQIRVSDASLLFGPSSLAPGVTLQTAHFNLYAMDAGLKYRGFAIQSEGYVRNLDHFEFLSGSLPYHSIRDNGFYTQASYTLPSRTIELYALTSQIFGQQVYSYEYGGGTNYRPFHTQNFRVNADVKRIVRSPVDSLFGYYIGGLKGMTVSISSDVFF